MQAASKVEILDVQPNILPQSIKATDVNPTVVSINGGSKKAAFRKFAAEQGLQPQVQFEESLTDRFNAGSLQNDVLVKKINPHTMIHKAILENSPVVIKFLLAQGVSVDYPDENGMSPLTIAILNRCNYAVEVLLEKKANTNPGVKWNNMSLLEISLFMKDPASASLLIKNGADVNASNQYVSVLTQTIHRASSIYQVQQRNAWVEVSKQMIHKGANIHANKENDCPLLAAVWLATSQNDKSVLELLLQKGVNVNMVQTFKGKDNGTALLAAITNGHYSLSVVQFLVESGADVNKSINNGWEIRSPLKFALSHEHAEIVQYLLQHGAKA